jgi:hypothetical protein
MPMAGSAAAAHAVEENLLKNGDGFVRRRVPHQRNRAQGEVLGNVGEVF